ncbi:hypothetical protein VP466E531_P0081 [Vibrio phage 466E53-1]|nr:hypothetical protein VP466E531_P0081 [Vibrio phage 466E53-1]
MKTYNSYEEAVHHAWHTSEPSEWDKQYFETAMK